MKIEKINRYCGYDGSSYFCLYCGKAGFRSNMQVRGHQSVCPGRNKTLLSPPLPAPPPPPPPPTFMGGMTTPPPAFMGGATTSPPTGAESWMQYVSHRMDNLERAVFNELPHRIEVGRHDDMSWLKWVLMALAIMWFVEKLGGGDALHKTVGKVGDKVLSKAMDKAMAGF